MIKGGKRRRNEQVIMLLAKNIKKYRHLRKLSQTDLANLIDQDNDLYSQISRMERGIVNSNVSMIAAVAKALNIKPFQLLEEEEI